MTVTKKKVSKTSVNYRKAVGTKRCGNCAMYHNTGHYCDLVGGVINRDQVCDRWVKQRG